MTTPPFIDRRQEKRPPSGEAPFHVGEVFYSRTNTRGIIQGGNYVFRRVSHYEWDDLIGAPHRIVRHPDMPRAVFRLLWDRIGQGKPLGAYVKNRASDGLHYWVYAVVAPWGDGYLSARIKPTGPLLPRIERLYTDLRRAEQDGLSPEDSAARLVARMPDLGFTSYDDFMIHALGEELLSETDHLKLPRDTRIERARTMLTHAEDLARETARLTAEFDVLSAVPHNMKVVAGRIEPTGGPFSALSRNYGEMSNDLSQWFLTNVLGEDSNFTRISAQVKQSLWLTCFAGIIHRCEEQLQAERRALGHTDIEEERRYLGEMANTYMSGARDATGVVAAEARRINAACDDIRRKLLGLATVRVACKIEDARNPARSGSLQGIIDQLGKSQKQIETHIGLIRDKSAQIIAGAEDANRASQSSVDDALLYGERMAQALHREAAARMDRAS